MMNDVDPSIIIPSIRLDASDNLGSDEESGKSWSELEEEARRGKRDDRKTIR